MPQHVLDAGLERDTGARAPVARPLHLHRHHPRLLVPPLENYVAAILRYCRSDASLQQLFDHGHDLVVVLGNRSTGRIQLILFGDDVFSGGVKVHHGGEHLGLQHAPVVLVALGDRHEVRAEEHARDAVDVEQLLRERRRHSFTGVGEVFAAGAVDHHGFAWEEHEGRGIGGRLRLDEDAAALPAERERRGGGGGGHPRVRERPKRPSGAPEGTAGSSQGGSPRDGGVERSSCWGGTNGARRGGVSCSGGGCGAGGGDAGAGLRMRGGTRQRAGQLSEAQAAEHCRSRLVARAPCFTQESENGV
mmetsp:Transcript_6727/g.17239  ORF Transcript_6727/g.17239 Transcript_6727/m.17239 type:complete len:304 (+) Transcript_6727:445-1356(+)